MTPSTQPTTMADLGRYLGKRVIVGDQAGTLVGLVNQIAFVQLDNQSGQIQKATRQPLDTVSPLLRSLSDLTEAEAKECFRIAFGKSTGPNYGLVVDREETINDDQICISAISEGLRLAIAYDCVSAWFLPRGSSVMHAMTFNAVALVRYLDSIDIGLDDTFTFGLKDKRSVNQTDWLTQLSETTSFNLDDLQKAFALVNEKEKFRTYVQIAELTGEQSMHRYINRLIVNRL